MYPGLTAWVTHLPRGLTRPIAADARNRMGNMGYIFYAIRFEIIPIMTHLISLIGHLARGAEPARPNGLQDVIPQGIEPRAL